MNIPKVGASSSVKPRIHSARKRASRPLILGGSVAILAACASFWSPKASSGTFYWDSDATAAGNALNGTGLGGTGIWNTSLLNWWDGVSIDGAWTDTTGVDTAIFTGTGGTVTIDTGAGITVNALQFSSSGYTILGNTASDVLTLAGGTPTITVSNSGDTATIGASLAGSAGFTKSGSGTLEITGQSTLTGGLTLSNGTLKLSGSGSLASATGGVSLISRATLTLDNSGTNLGDRISGPVVAAGGTINFIGNAAATSEDAGALTLNAGALNINSTPGAGTSTLTFSSITRNAGSTLYVNGTGLGGAANQVVTTTAPTTTNGILKWAVVNNGSLISFATAANGASLAPLALASHNQGSETTWVAASNVRPTADVTVTNARSLYSLTLDSGIDLLAPAADRTLTITGAVLQTGGSSVIGATSTLENILAWGANEALFITIGTLQLDRGNTNTLTGSGGFTKSGAGTLILNGVSTLTGAFNVNEGILELRGATSLFTTAASINLNGATLRLSNDSSTTFTGNSLVVNQDSTVQVDRVTAAATSTTHTLGSLSIGGGRTLFVSSNDITSGTAYGLAFGAATLTGAATLDVANNGAGLGTLTLSTMTGAFPLTKAGAGDLTLTGGGFSGPVEIRAGRVIWNTTLTLAEASVFSGTGAILKSGSGTVNLSGANTFTGGVTVSAGVLGFSTVSDNGGGPSNLGQGTDGLVLNGGTFSFIGGTSQSTNRAMTMPTAGTLSANGTSGATITFAGLITGGTDQSLTLTGTGAGLITGGITQPVGTVVADLNVNSGTWTLSGPATAISDDVVVTGATAVLNLASTGVLGYVAGSSNGLYLRSGATVNLQANDVTGLSAAGGNDFILIGDSGAGVLNTNGFKITTPRLDVGDDDNLIDTGAVNGSGTVTSSDYNLLRGTVSANLAGAGAIEKYGLGDVTLSGDNSGLTTSASATRVDLGNLILDYTTSNTTKLSATNSLDVRGGTLTINGNASADTTQTVLALTLANGGSSAIVVNRGGTQAATLVLGAITRTVSTGTVRFTLPASGAITTTTPNTNGILGGWATIFDSNGKTTFAANDGSGNIVAITPTTKNSINSWTAGEHLTDDTTGYTGTLGTPVAVGSIRFDAPGSSTITIADGLALGINSGGILQTSAVTSGSTLITGGKLESNSSSELIFTTDSTQLLTVASTVTGAGGITKSGNGTLRLTGNNNYTGTTRLLTGTLQVSGGNAIGDSSAVTFSATQNVVLELLNSETIGALSGGVSANLVSSELRLNGNAVTVNQTASGVFAGTLTGNGSSSFIKTGTGNLNFASAVTSGFTGGIVVNGGLFFLSGSTTTGATSITVNKGGSFMIDNTGGTTTNVRIGDAVPITLNSADGSWLGETRPSGLVIRRDQGSSTTETVGVISLNSGASYTRMDASATNAVSVIVADNITRANRATLDVRGSNMVATSGQRGQLRIGTAGNQTAFINAMVGGASTTAGTKNISIVPWAIAEEYSTTLADTNMGNSLATYISGVGFRALNLSTEYNTYATAGTTDNTRESLTTTDLTGLTGKTINSLVLHNANTGASVVEVLGSGAGQTLAVTSGAMLFTLNTGATASSAHSIVLGGFNSGITVGSTNEYVFHVVNPSSVAATPTLTAAIASPLTSTADITKSGRGTLILTATNTAGGGAMRTTINEGVLQISDLDNIGGNSGSLVFAGGTLRLAAASTIVGTSATVTIPVYSGDDLSLRTITFLNGGGTIDTNGSDLTLANGLGSGSGSFTKAGAGNMTLNAAATLTGSTVLSVGTITLGANNAIGTGDLTVAAGATLAMGAFSASVANVTLPNSATAALTGVGPLTVSGTMTVNRGTVSPMLTGAMNLIKQTASQTVVLTNAASNFTGYTHVQDGILSVASLANAGVASALGAPTGDNAAIRLGSTTTTGTLVYTGATGGTNRIIALAGTTGGGIIDNDGTGALTLSGAITGTQYGAKTITLQGATTGFTNVASGAISNGLGTVGVIKAEAGTWSLTGANTYSGGTTIGAGTLIFDNLGNLGTGGIAMTGGRLQWSSGNTADISTRTVTFATASSTYDTNGNDVTLNNAIGGTAAFGIIKAGAGTLTLAGTNTFTGTSSISAGKLQVGNGTTGSLALGSGNLVVANTAANAVLNLVAGGTITANMLQVGSVSGSFGAVNITGGTINMTQAESTPDATESFGAANGAYGALSMTGGIMNTTRFMFGGVSGSTGTGGIGVGRVSNATVNTTGFLIIARAGASTGVLTLDSGTINHAGATQDVHIGYQGTGRAELNILGGLLDNSGRNVKFGGGGWTGTGILNLNGGTLKTNVFTTSGTSYLNFNGGTLQANVSSASFLPALTAVTINGAFGSNAGGAVIDTNTFDITIAANLLAPAGNGVSTIAVADGGSGYIGAPTVLISGGTGATAIANMVDDGTGNGTLKVGSITVTNPGTGYSGTPTYTFTGGGATVAATAGTITTAANTSGGLTKTGGGTLTLTGTNTFGGAVNVTGGSLTFSTSANLGDATKSTNTIGLNGGGLSYSGSGALDLGANRVLTVGASGGTLDVSNAAGVLTVSGGVANTSSGNLVKSGAGTAILSGTTNLNGGATSVTGGVLKTGFGASGTSALSVAAGATLHNLDASGTTLVLPNTGALTLNAGASLATASTLGFGLNASSAAGITLTSGGAFTLNGSGTIYIDLFSLGGPISETTYNLLSVPGGNLLTGTGGAVNYALNDVIGGYTFTLNQTATLVSVTVASFAGSLYWHGDLTGPAGSWTDYRAGDTNWRNAATGGSDLGITPGSATTVVFSATEATGPAISTTLDGAVTIKNLQFTSNPTGVNAITIAPGTGGTLTLAPTASTDGIDVADNAGAVTISAPMIASTNQTWNVVGTGANGSSLTLSGGLSGAGTVTKTGAGTLTFSAVNATYGANIVWNGGILDINATGTSSNNLTFNGIISGSGSGPLVKDGAGNLILNGANTYTGGTSLNGGTTILGNKQGFGTGVVNTVTNAPILQASVDLSGSNKIANAFLLDTNLTISGTNNIELGGVVTTSTGNRTLTNSLTGAAVLTLSGGVVLGEATGARNLTINGAGNTILNSVVSNGTVTGGWLVKGGTGNLTLNFANTYTGFTIIDQGSLILGTGVNQSMTNTFYFGSSSGATTAGTLDLSNASATFTATTAFWNQINSTTATPAIIIGSGQSLNLNGNVLIGNNTGASTTTLMTVSGAGTVNVTNSTSGASFRVGGYTGSTAGQGNRARADFSGLATLNISLNTTNGTVAVSNSGTGNTAGKYSTMILAATTNITAKTLAIGDGGSNAGTPTQANELKLGSTVTNLNVDTINIGTGSRDNGTFTFNTTTGTVTVHGVAGTTARTALNIGTTGGGTGVSGAEGNTFDVTGHTANLMLGAVAIGTQNRGAALVNRFLWDKGQVDMTSLTVSTRTAAASTGSGPFTTDSTITLGSASSTLSDTVVIQNGILQFAQTSGAANTTSVQTATLNVAGGAVTIGQTSGTAITMAAAVASTTANAYLNFSGGTTTLQGNIVKTGGAGTTSATVTLTGTATLDMTGKAIGSAAQTISFVAESGTLRALGQLNGGGTLTKTTAGTLTMAGTHSYTGATNVDAGTMIVSGSISGTTATVASLATLNVTGTVNAAVVVNGNLTGGSTDGLTGAVNNTVTVNAGGVVNPGSAANGANTGILTASSVSLKSDATLSLRLDNTTAGAGHDRLVTSSVIDLNNDSGTGALLSLDVSNYSFHFGDLFFVVINNGAGAMNAVGTTFANVATTTYDEYGTYDVIKVNGMDFAVSRFGNAGTSEFDAAGGNDIVLMAVPEPNSLSMLGASLGLAIGLQRFRRQRRAVAAR